MSSIQDPSPRVTTPSRRLVGIVAASALLGIFGGLGYVALSAMYHGKARASAALHSSPLAPVQVSAPPPAAPVLSSPTPRSTPAASPATPPPSLLPPLDDSGASGIFFLRRRDIWLANLDGSSQQQITHSGRVEHYFWVPKTQTLVYDDSPPTDKEDILIETINTLDLATREVEVVHKSTIRAKCEGELCPDFFFALDVSPDGKIIFGEDFLGDLAESKREGVAKEESRVVYYPDTRKYESSNDLPGSAPMHFLPDGSVAAWADDGNVYTYSFVTKRRTQWTHYPSRLEDYKQHNGNVSELPAAFDFIGWSPDASRIFFTCGTSAYGNNVVAACETSLANPEIKKLSPDTKLVNPQVGFAMTPDRKYFYFQLPGWMPSKIDTTTGEYVQVALNTIGLPLPSPSGKIVLYVPMPPSYSLWLMNSDGSGRRRILTDADSVQWRY